MPPLYLSSYIFGEDKKYNDTKIMPSLFIFIVSSEDKEINFKHIYPFLKCRTDTSSTCYFFLLHLKIFILIFYAASAKAQKYRILGHRKKYGCISFDRWHLFLPFMKSTLHFSQTKACSRHHSRTVNYVQSTHNLMHTPPQ